MIYLGIAIVFSGFLYYINSNIPTIIINNKNKIINRYERRNRDVYNLGNKCLKIHNKNTKLIFSNLIEWLIVNNCNYNSLEHLPKYYGIYYTNYGYGSMYELVKDYDGKISQTLQKYIRDNGITDELLLAVKNLNKYCLDNNIIIDALSLGNILVKINCNKITLYICDGLGDKIESIFLFLTFNFVKRQVIKYKCKKLNFLVRNCEVDKNAKLWRKKKWIDKLFG